MRIRLEFDRIAPGVEIGPHRHGVETIVYLAGGGLVFEHGEALERRALLSQMASGAAGSPAPATSARPPSPHRGRDPAGRDR